MENEKRELLYIADPMCSWCWGFAPVITALREKYADVLDVSLTLGGLRVGTAERLPEQFKKQVLHHWHEVHKATGQPFGFDFNLPEDFCYDTEPSCRATVTVRDLEPAATFPYFESLHHAFYVENRDVTDAEILAELAEAQGVEGEAFRETFEAKETQLKTYDDFARAHSFGIQGFPSAVLRDESGPTLLTIGYQPLERLEPRIDQWLKQGSEQATM